jgi:hypothetical protein
MTTATYEPDDKVYIPLCARPACNRPESEHHTAVPQCHEIPPCWSGDGPCDGVHDHEFERPYLQHFFRDVPGLGSVAVSRHAQKRAEESGITEKQFTDALLTGQTIPDGLNEVFREKNGVRVVILLKPTPDRGARLVKTVFRPTASTVILGRRR